MSRLIVQGSGNYTPPPEVVGQLIYCSGASNTWGPNPGLPGISANGAYWDTDATPGGSGIVSSSWHPFHGTSFHPSHGPDRSLVEALFASPTYNGGKLAVLNVSLGSSPYPIWQPASPRFPLIQAATQAALALLPSAFPQVTRWEFRCIRNQGSSDMIVNDLAYQQQWAAAQTNWETAMKNLIFAPALVGVEYTWKPTLLIQQCTQLQGAFFVSQGVIPQQYIWTDTNHVLDCDPPTVAYEPDFVHYTQGGNITVGSLAGTRTIFLDSIGQ